MEIRMEVTLTDGYQQRFTSACLAQIGSRKEAADKTRKIIRSPNGRMIGPARVGYRAAEPSRLDHEELCRKILSEERGSNYE